MKQMQQFGIHSDCSLFWRDSSIQRGKDFWLCDGFF